MELEISKANNNIKTIEQWLRSAPPMGKERHWKDDKSAKSLAQFMTDKEQVKKLEDVLNELGYDTRGVISCTPEHNTALPGSGNGRNHDLLMAGNDFVAGIEAKVSETLGKSISEELKDASDNKRYRISALAKKTVWQ